MKIIDLLNKIADGEEAPKKIKYKNYIYEYQHRRDTLGAFNYMCNENGEYLSRRYFIDNILNDEVEILEEPKGIPEKLSTWYTVEQTQNLGENCEFANCNFETMYEKINEIINYLESKGESND